MEDYPAGPASPGTRRAPFSVVIPVRDGGRDLGRCLRALGDSAQVPFETIVVDDGSADGSADLARSLGATVLRNAQGRGPAAARNTGALAAKAPIIFFLDADVAVHPETLARAARRFEADPGLAAIFGSYDDRPAAPGLVSRFRNLLHHHTHQQGPFADDARPAHTFWTGCGAIRRDVFHAMGGFDPFLYRRPAIEDIELGYRLRRAGHRILLDRSMQATHLKRWSLREMVRTDIFRRGVPWMLLMLRSHVAESDLNVSPAQRACVASTGLAGLGPLLALATLSPLWLLMTAACVLFNVAVNARFYRFLLARLGPVGAAGSVGLHGVYFACCGLSVVIASALWYAGRFCGSRGRRAAGLETDRARPHAAAAPAPGPHGAAATQPAAGRGRAEAASRQEP